MLILQILCIALGVYALTQKQIKLGSTRVLREEQAKIIGVVLLGGGIMSLLFGNQVAIVSLAIAIGYAFTQTQG